MRPTAIALFACVLMSPAWALAAGGEHHGGELHLSEVLTNYEFLASVVNFGLLLFLINKLGGKSLVSFLKTRRNDMEQAISEASAMKAKAEARYKEYTERMETLDVELKKLKDDIARGAEEDKKRIIAEAHESTARLKAETESLIALHAESLAREVRAEVVEAALTAARETLLQTIDPNDQQRLAEQFKQRLSERRDGGRA